MTLSRQLLAIICTLYLLVLVGTTFITVDNTRRYLGEQLAAHAQDTATSLGLSLSGPFSTGDTLLMESMVDAIFDRGYYREIVVEDLEGAHLVNRVLTIQVHGVPSWFVRWLPLTSPRGTANLMAGWRQGGRVHVAGHPGFAYEQLWSNTVEILWWSLGALALAIAATSIALRVVLRPLAELERQAVGITERRFTQLTTIPGTRELARVVIAMNRMTGKVESMLDEQTRQAESLRDAAYTDPVTGLGNRRAFERDVEALAGDEDHQAYGALVLLELSGLDEVNRRDGYEAGDRFLCAAGAALQRRAEYDGPGAIRLARIGGGRFSAVLTGVPRDTAARVAERLAGPGAGDSVTVSDSGFAYHDGYGGTEDLVREAEAALAGSGPEPAGGAVPAPVAPAPAGEASELERWRERIETAIADQAVTVLEQPVRATADDRVIQVEALARLRAHDGELIPAGVFLPMATRLGLAIDLDRAVIEAVLGTADGGGATVAINLSGEAVADADFHAWLERRLRVGKGAGRRVAFEVSEPLAIAHESALLELAARLRPLRAGVGVDHGGAADIGLAYQQRLRCDYVKIDGSFVRGIDGDAARQAYVRSLVSVGHSLDLVLVAERVESDGELAVVRELGFDAVQGHLIGRPSPPSAAVDDG